MAINKTITLDSGINASYWKIAFIAYNYSTNEGRIDLVAYLNKAARDSGKSPIHGAQAAVILGPEEMLALNKIPLNVITGKATTGEDLEKARAYTYLRTQKVKNPRHEIDKTLPALIQGEFAGDNAQDV